LANAAQGVVRVRIADVRFVVEVVELVPFSVAVRTSTPPAMLCAVVTCRSTPAWKVVRSSTVRARAEVPAKSIADVPVKRAL